MAKQWQKHDARQKNGQECRGGSLVSPEEITKAGRSGYVRRAVVHEMCGEGESIARMVLPLDVALEIRAVKVDVAQIAGGVSLGLVVEVR